MTVFTLIDVEDFVEKMGCRPLPLELYQGRVHVACFDKLPNQTFTANVGPNNSQVACAALRIEDRDILYWRLP